MATTINWFIAKENLIDEVFLDLEAKIFGRWINLFKEWDFEKDLELQSIKLLSKNTIQLHYKVLK